MPGGSVELRDRTRQFAVRIVKLFRALPRSEEARVLGMQMLRSGTSVAAHYRALCRSSSDADFSAKLAVLTAATDETVFWLELLIDTGIVSGIRLEKLLSEANELMQIFGSAGLRATGKQGAKSLEH
jgi:four helix bundle protein